MDAIRITNGTKEYPWTFGESNRFKVSTYLEGEREIDVDDEAAVLNVMIEMLPNSEKLVAVIKEATLDYDFTGQNIILHGMQDPLPAGSNPQKGTISLTRQSVDLKPGEPFIVKVTVKTGFWGSTEKDKAARMAAPAGQKIARVNLKYELRHDSPDGRASEDEVLLFCVAKD